jgi:SAM-dependent methyltransferase
MNWRRKARIQKAIAALPAADAIHYAAQRRFGTLRPGRHDPRDWLAASARMARWIAESGRDLAGRTVLEVGTGRTVDLPMGLWLCGAGPIVTVDLNRYLSADLTDESVRFVRAHADAVLECFGEARERPGFTERFGRLVDFRGGLDDLLRMMSVEYRSPADATRLPRAAASVDYHVSYAVMEHIPGATIAAILAEARRLLRPDGLLVHVIDPSDHFSHEDGSITTVNFLRFGEREWQRLAGNKFAYHNRLRAHEFVDLFTRAGARIVRRLEATDEAALRALHDGFPLHPSFRHIPPEQLAVRSITLTATFERSRALAPAPHAGPVDASLSG